MKKVLFVLGAFLCASIINGVDAFAYNYINSTSFVRMPARAATISTPDAVFYNPVGLVKIEDGFYTHLGNNFIVKKYSHEVAGVAKYTDDTPVLFSMFGGFIYKKDKGALFLCNYVPDGGGMTDYRDKNGMRIATLTLEGYTAPISYIHAYKFWVQIAFGGSYAFTDWLAVTGGLYANIYYYDQTFGMRGVGSIANTTWRADGWSGFAGIMITPHKAINFTAKYAIECIARGKVTDKKLHYSKIEEARLPAYILLGMNIKPHEKIELQLSYQLNFTQQKDYANTLTASREFAYVDPYGSTLMTGGNTQDYKHKLTHAAGMGIEGRVHERILLSCGVGYENAWVHPRAQNPFDPKLASVVVGFGGRFKATHTMDIDIGILKNTYFSDKMAFGLIELNKDVWVFSIDLSTKWF